MEREGAHSVGGQLHRVQQGHLDEAVGLGATSWPVLITFHLQRDSRGGQARVSEGPKGSDRQGPGQELAEGPAVLAARPLASKISDLSCHPLTRPNQGLTLGCHPCPREGNEGRN